MPELPDVEVYRRLFYHTSLNKKIRDVKKVDSDILEDIGKKSFIDLFKGSSFTKTARHGKYFFAATERDGWTVFHFGMAGEFIYHKHAKKIPEYTRAYFDFRDSAISYVCTRKLGMITVVDSMEDFIKKKDLGPDALDIARERFVDRIKGKKMIKSALTDQSILAGIGNIYADEILFHARIHPGTKADRLDKASLDRIFKKIHKVFKTAIDNKADPSRLPRTWLIHSRREASACPGICSEKIKKIRINNRPTYFCPSCQKNE